jgi:hypothetical protein
MDETTVSNSAFEINGITGYRIQNLLAYGGMGGVYLAQDENLKRWVAIKVIHPEFTKDPDYIKRFTREALIVAGFRHANIVTVYASGWLSGKQYIVMEYVGGGTLAQIMKSGPIEEGLAARIAHQMADALAYAHQREVIHRDFKPANILMREDGTPVLSDFGIAKSDITGAGETAVGIIVGNMRYMAPEQGLGQTLSNRVDVYCFGLVFYEMLVGGLPAQHPVRTKQDAKAIIRSVRRDFGELISRCLSVEPTARPSATECREWLDSRVNAAKPVRLNRRLVLIGALCAIVLAGGLALRNVILSYSRGSPTISPRVPSAGRPDAQMLTLQRFPASAKIFLDGKELADSAAPLSAGEHELVAVAYGYYGDFHRVAWQNGQRLEPVSFVLEPTSLPSAEEVQRFLKLADAKTLIEDDLETIGDRTFRTALQAKLLSQAGQTGSLERLSHQVDALRRYGDSRAAVAALLVGAVQAGRISRSQVTQALIAASDAGDAMASLFLAVAYRESISATGARVADADPRFLEYCRRMGRASAQGWEDVATEYSRRDGCTK